MRATTPSLLSERLYGRLVPCADPACGCDCLLWPGALTTYGYGRINFGGKSWRVHRLVYTLEVGPIPGGLVIDHVRARGCMHRNCANVAHLEAVTIGENVRRGPKHRNCAPRPWTRGRQTVLSARNAAKTHCPAGHEYDEANTYLIPSGGRGCRACHRRWDKERRERKRRPAA